jgi:hypothetical protein
MSVLAQNAQDPAPPERASPQARVEIGVGETDNLNHDAAELRSDIDVLGVAFDARRTEGPLLRGAIKGDVHYMKYGAVGLDVNHEVLGSVDGGLELHIVPERFEWDTRYDYGQVRADPRAAVGPTNRLDTTTASTGPMVTLPAGDRNSVELAAQISDRHFESTQSLDSQLTTTRFALRRMLNQVTRIGLVYEGNENEFDVGSDVYKFKIASLEYRKELASGLANLSVGRGRVDIAGRSEATTVARVNWNRALGTRSRIEVFGGKELTDAGSLFAAGAVVGQGPLSALAEVSATTDNRLHGVVLTNSPLRRESLGVHFQVAGQLGTFGASVATAQDRFDTDTLLDNDATSTSVTATRQFGRRWRGELLLSRWDQRFTSDQRKTVDDTYRLSLARTLGGASQVSVTLERNSRDSLLDPYSEKVVRVLLGHDFRR